jgi:hypothetical protein
MSDEIQSEAKESKFLGTMPTYRELFPEYGAVGERSVRRILNNLHQRDCLMILSQLSKHYYKYCQRGCGGENSLGIYKQRCLELLEPQIQKRIQENEPDPPKDYMVIFPEPSIVHLIKLCLLHCDSTNYTKEEDFPQDTLYGIGKSLLIVNSIFADWQLKNTSEDSRMSLDLLANLSKQQIVDKNFDMSQQMYQNYFIFKNLLDNYSSEFDIQKLFQEKFGVEIREYFAFLMVLQGQYDIKDTPEEDWALPYLDFDIALKNLKPKYQRRLLDSLLINNLKYKKIDLSFFNVTDIVKQPLVRLPDNKIIPLNLRRLFNRLSSSVYFDLLDFISNDKEKSAFSQYFGYAVEDYFKSLVQAIDTNVLLDQRYGKDEGQEANDAILVQTDSVIFFECKKRPFHNLEFLQKGDGDDYLKRLKEAYFKPLEQICKRIKDFRDGKFSIEGVSKDVVVYPVVVSPASPPLFSGAWDKFNLNQYVLPEDYSKDKQVAQPEFIDFSELGYIEEVLKRNLAENFVDLIKKKRADTVYYNANFSVFLHKNRMIFYNKRMLELYLAEVESFKELLFEST